MTISEKIYKLRTKSGFSQEVFAEKLDVTRQSVQKWESGLSLPTIEKLISIATLFNVSMTTFATRQTPKFPTGEPTKNTSPITGKCTRGSLMLKVLKSNTANSSTRARMSRI